MPREFSRSRRVAEQIKRELARLIATEVKDPRAAGATVTDVEVSRDLAHAKVYVGLFDLDGDGADVVAALRRAGGFLRGRLGADLRLRSVPELHFIEDVTEREAHRLSRLIDDAVAEDDRRHGDEGEGSRDG
ncbi:ribosome-binding factor A [Salinisphaera sp. PC39]|uniref:30S ribosome-binding factor RbfA n=1 Tax=Salinisphaera sp. PC39 TaxID=1304156 RepID=UPI00333FBA17